MIFVTPDGVMDDIVFIEFIVYRNESRRSVLIIHVPDNSIRS